MIYLRLTNRELVCAEIRGTLSAPDRPKVGEIIYWPFASTVICDGNGGCTLAVYESYWDTVDIGRIQPQITLGMPISDDDPASGYCEYTKLAYLEGYFEGACKLLTDPQVWWPESADYEPSWLPLPESIDDYPAHIKNMMIDD